MSAILQAAPKTAAGNVAHNPTNPITHYHAGLPFTAAGVLAVEYNAVVTYHHQGIPFGALGRVVVTGSAPDYFSSGCAGYAASDKNLSGAVSGATPINYNHGVGYRGNGACALQSV